MIGELLGMNDGQSKRRNGLDDSMMYINKQDIEKILEVMNKFPDAESFALAQESSSGIGSVTTLTVRTRVNELDGEFSVEISGEENW